MTPEVDGMINSTAMRLMMHVFPNLPQGYSQGSANLTAMLLLFSAQQFDNAAELRVRENEALRKLLARAGDFANLEAVTPAGSVKISALNAENHALKRELIKLHTAVEEAKGEGAKALERDILAFLKDMAAKRRLHLPGA